MDLEWLSSTTNTADFQIRLTNTSTVPVTFNALVLRGVHAAGLTTGTISWVALNDNTIPGWLAWPQTTTNLPYTASTRKLNFSSGTSIFTSVTAQTIPTGAGVIVGSFRVSTTTTWVANSNFGFVWDGPTATSPASVVGYINGGGFANTINQTGVSGGTTCGSCLTVTASALQPLNPQPPSSSVLSGTATICAGTSTNLSVEVTGGISPYTVTVTDGTNNYSATSASPVSIPVSPTTTSTYTIVSVTGGGTGTGNTGTATVTVTPIPTQPTLACYQTATFNTATCVWDVTGTQPAQPTLACYETATFNGTTCLYDITGTQAAAPTGLACYESAAFNTTTCAWVVSGTQAAQPTGLSCWQTAAFNTVTCAWDVTGTQATAPTGLACYETATFNTTSCAWVVSGTQTTNTTTITGQSGSYTWANNGQTYTASGIYTGNVVNCVAQVLNLTIDPAIRMDLEWLSSTTNTADFQIRLTNTSTVPVTFNALVLRGVHAAGLTTGTISWVALNDNTIPAWLAWPQTGTTALPYTASTRKLNFSSGTSIFTSATAPTIPSGAGVIVGSFRVSTTTTWVANSNFGFVWDGPTASSPASVVGYINGGTFANTINQTGVSGGTTCGSCLTVTASALQPLNPQVIPPPSSSVLTGDATICAGTSTNLSVAVTGGVSPYTVTVTDGTSNYSATGSSPVSISVSPSATSTYSIVSVTGGGTGTGNTGTAIVTVAPAPAATISYSGAPFCSSSTTVQAVSQTGNTGGTYSSTAGLTINASTGEITPNSSTAGTYTVTYTIAAASPCAALSFTTSVTIAAAQSATIAYSNPTICGSSTTVQSVTQTGTTGGTYSSTTGLSINATTGAITPNTSTVGAYTVTYSLVASAVCPEVSTTTNVTISSALTTPTISYTGSPFCKSLTSPQVVTQTGSTGGVYTSTAGLTINSSTGAITPSTSTATTAVVNYLVTYTVTATGCVSVSATVTVPIGPVTSGTISYAGNPFCKSNTSAQAITRSTIPATTGTFSISPVTGLLINTTSGGINAPSNSTAGVYTVTLTLTNAQTGGCGITTFTTPVTITAAPTQPAISYSGSPFCKTLTSAQSVTQSGTAGGTYSSTTGLSIIPSTGAITPSLSTAGTYTVTYTTPAGTGCTALSTTINVTITAPPAATISYAGSPFCKTLTTAQAVTRTGTLGGTFTSTTGLTISVTTGAITPSSSTAGTYTVTLTLAAAGGCAAVTTTTSVTITTTPTVTLAYTGTPFCSSASPVSVTQTGGAGAYTGGTYTSAAGLSINASTGQITPSSSTAGTYTVTYTIPAGSGCAAVLKTTSVTITALPAATITYAGSPFCKTLTTGFVTRTGTTGGTYTVSPTGLSIVSNTGAINPSSSTVGTYTVTYTVAAANGCAAVSTTTSVIITAAPTQPTITYSGSPFCSSSPTVQAVSQTGTTGGTYSSTPGLDISSTTGALTPSTSTAGTYTVTYSTAAAGGCSALSTTTSVTISASPAQPTLACYETAVFNTTTCAWAVSGTQPAQPTGLSCWQTAAFNTTSCAWDVSGTQATAPTGLACYESATFNTTTCAWVVSGTQTTNTTTITTSGSYTWANNGQIYTASGIYTGNEVNCVAQVLDLTITIIRMDLEWLSSTTNTADFQVRITNTGTVPVTFNSVIVRGVHAANLTTGTVSWIALNDNTIPAWLAWPQITTNLPYTASTRKLNFSSGTSIFTSATAPTIPSGAGVIIGTFRVSTTTTWVPNSDFGFVWDATGAVIGYINTSSTVSTLQQTGASGNGVCGSCLTVTASSAQPLNASPTASILSGDATICAGASSNLSVAVTGGTAPYTVTVTDGTNNYSATGASPVSIPVSPSATSTYSIVSVTGGGTGTGNSGSATVTVTPIPAQPTLACYQTAVFNTATCVWDVSGTQAAQPTGLACYQTAVFNSATCVWDVSGTQAAAPTGLACWQTATFNTATCVWDVLPESIINYNVTNGGGIYTINGSNNPTINLLRGLTYTFTVNVPGHPFYIKTSLTTGTESTFDNGVTNNGTQTGTITFTVPYDAPSTLYYICEYHSAMSGTINISNVAQAATPTGLACYQTAAFNTATCVWDVSGTQAAQPTLACYESAVFNTVTCVWDVSGTQATAPTVLACYESATFNTTTCAWVVSGTQPAQPTLGCNETAAFNTTSCAWVVTVGSPCSSTLNITMFIEGYYIGANTMTPVKANEGVGSSLTDVDDISIELRNPDNYEVVATTQGVLQTNGTAECTFSTAQSGSFYIVVKHRNALETWSAEPVTIGASSSYNFTTAANKAFGDNMKEVEAGVWAFYSGDINQDGFIEGSDFPPLFNDNDEFAEGYLITDINGDGFVEGSDYPILFNNSDNFIESYHPY